MEFNSLLNIPRELLALIISFLDKASMFMLSATSKSLQRVVCSEWKPACPEYFLHDILCDAASNGYINVFRWLVPKPEQHMPFMYITQCAAINDHIEIIKYIHEGNSFYKDNIMDYAVAGGQLSTVKWLLENGFTWDEWACIYAAMFEHIDILQYLQTKLCENDT